MPAAKANDTATNNTTATSDQGTTASSAVAPVSNPAEGGSYTRQADGSLECNAPATDETRQPRKPNEAKAAA